MLFLYSKCPAVINAENDRVNSSKSFSVMSLRFPRGTLGVKRSCSSSSIVAEVEDECSLLERVIFWRLYIIPAYLFM